LARRRRNPTKDIEKKEEGGVKEEEMDGKRDGQSGRIQLIEG